MRVIFTLLSLVIFGLSGCSSKSVQEPNSVLIEQSDDDELDSFSDEMEVKEIYDPLSGYNRIMTSFNDGAYEYVLKPVSTGYANALHKEIRISIDNFFNNIYFPMSFVNNILQGKFCYAGQEGARFVVNTTVGIAGLFDPAKSYFEIEAHKEDFGQTLGFYGVGSGPHIVLPLLGPSNLRDLAGMYPDSFLTFIDYDERSYWTLTDTPPEYIGAKSFEYINYISLNKERYEKMREDAVDLYPYLRDIYEQRRNKLIEE
ncbi:MAG: VacJ family lipoprotein [Sulfurimonas sp.]|jgi:phospholipid-binding lipoprotein MlaA|uniref:MlaA family lipoprotein n=1 Tax=Sulfurimonas sp. TaxID=2022749 RepID=UPI0026114B8C|nr:VacJ family lipoprotein [Sulfurimonas sp.]MDD3476915.1 VacJ family lipoprotein [Sulfurimonas sp.]